MENLAGARERTLLLPGSVTRWWIERPKHFTKMYCEFYLIFFETRSTKSSNLESKSLRMGDWLDFL